MKQQSYFDDTVKEHLIHEIKCKLMIIITLGFAYPWVLCDTYKHHVEHTVIEGRRLTFNGNPKEIFKYWLLSLLLIFLTLGLYKIVANIHLNKWLTAHTTFVD